MGKQGFNEVSAARTRAAKGVAAKKLAAFQKHGGAQKDLDAVVAAGETAFKEDSRQAAAQADGKGSSRELDSTGGALFEEHAAFRRALAAARGAMARAGASAAVLARVDGVVSNRAASRMAEVEVEASPEEPAGEAKTKKEARRVRSIEAKRAEAERDAVAALDVPELLAELEGRGWAKTRIEALQTLATGLSDKVSERAVKKGSAKEATQAERDAITAQNAAWGAVYPILAAMAREDAEVAELMKGTAAR